MSNYQNLLVAIDFSDASRQVITRAKEIALRNKAILTVMHVVEYLPPMDIAYEPVSSIAWIDEAELLEHGKTSMNKFVSEHQLGDTRQVVILGTPKMEICRYARENHCDLLVIGSHGRHGIQLLLGSTANAVLHDMPCDVLAVKLEKK